jgi:hypothetical protein
VDAQLECCCFAIYAEGEARLKPASRVDHSEAVCRFLQDRSSAGERTAANRWFGSEEDAS